MKEVRVLGDERTRTRTWSFWGCDIQSNQIIRIFGSGQEHKMVCWNKTPINQETWLDYTTKAKKQFSHLPFQRCNGHLHTANSMATKAAVLNWGFLDMKDPQNYGFQNSKIKWSNFGCFGVPSQSFMLKSQCSLPESLLADCLSHFLDGWSLESPCYLVSNWILEPA